MSEMELFLFGEKVRSVLYPIARRVLADAMA